MPPVPRRVICVDHDPIVQARARDLLDGDPAATPPSDAAVSVYGGLARI